MAAADEKGQPPPELRLAWWCSGGRLPDAGGVLDQDYKTMHLMTAALSIYNTVKRVRGLVGDQIHTITDAERNIVKYLRSEDLWDG